MSEELNVKHTPDFIAPGETLVTFTYEQAREMVNDYLIKKRVDIWGRVSISVQEEGKTFDSHTGEISDDPKNSGVSAIICR